MQDDNKPKFILSPRTKSSLISSNVFSFKMSSAKRRSFNFNLKIKNLLTFFRNDGLHMQNGEYLCLDLRNQVYSYGMKLYDR